MFYRLSRGTTSSSRSRFQCVCGTEYGPGQTPSCPACGKRIPRAVSLDDGPWKSFHQFRIDSLQHMLQPDALDQIPQEHRARMRQQIARQIRELEDGSWKSVAQDRIRMLRRMLDSDTLKQTPSDEGPDMRKAFESQLQSLQEELEVFGDGTATQIDPPDPLHVTGAFTTPRVTRREWTEDPLHVAQKIAAALAPHLQPEQMSPSQRHLFFAFFYLTSLEGGGHGQLLFNATESEPDNSLQFIRESLQTLATPAHLDMLKRAIDRWNATPRSHPTPPSDDRPAFQRWVDETFTPLKADFHDLDEAILALQPSLESCIAAFLQAHPEFVTIVESL